MSGWVQAVEQNREEIVGKWLAGQSINELALYYCLRQPTLERLIRQAFQQTVRLVADQARCPTNKKAINAIGGDEDKPRACAGESPTDDVVTAHVE